MKHCDERNVELHISRKLIQSFNSKLKLVNTKITTNKYLCNLPQNWENIWQVGSWATTTKFCCNPKKSRRFFPLTFTVVRLEFSVTFFELSKYTFPERNMITPALGPSKVGLKRALGRSPKFDFRQGTTPTVFVVSNILGFSTFVLFAFLLFSNQKFQIWHQWCSLPFKTLFFKFANQFNL